MFEDRHLLRRLHAGDKAALRRIYEKYIDDLLQVALSLLSDIQSAEDCLHDVFVDFAATHDGLMINKNLKRYLVSCVANRARDQLRKQTRQWKCKSGQFCSADTQKSPATQLIAAEESARVFDALEELPHQQREVLVLHVQGQMRFREIAGLLGVSINSVQSRYRYGIKKLRTILQKENRNEIETYKAIGKSNTV
jgi:RNA polymerase sigma-70 factor (ECF subfamily)